MIEKQTLLRRYLDALEAGRVEEALAFYAGDVVQEEFPNRLYANGQRRDLAAIRASAEHGLHRVRQRYVVLSAVEGGDSLAAEVDWTGELLAAAGPLAAGTELHARIGLFLTFRDGRIVSQRNYDCYDPF